MVMGTLPSSIRKHQIEKIETPFGAFVMQQGNGRRTITLLRTSFWIILRPSFAPMGLLISQSWLMQSNLWSQTRWIPSSPGLSQLKKSTKLSNRCIPKNLQAPMVCPLSFTNTFDLLLVNVSPKLFWISWTWVLFLQILMKHILFSFQRPKIPQEWLNTDQ